MIVFFILLTQSVSSSVSFFLDFYSCPFLSLLFIHRWFLLTSISSIPLQNHFGVADGDCGHDGIPKLFLQKCKQNISLTIFNSKNLSEDIFPDMWKEACIISLQKKATLLSSKIIIIYCIPSALFLNRGFLRTRSLAHPFFYFLWMVCFLYLADNRQFKTNYCCSFAY